MGASQILNKILQIIRKITTFLRNLTGSSKRQQTPVVPTPERDQTSIPDKEQIPVSTQKIAQPQNNNPMNNHVEGYGWIPDKPDARDLKYSVSQPVTQKLPLKVDLRAQLPPVYAQGAIGSCTAQSVCAAFHFCQMKEKLYNYAPSRLFTYYTTRDIEGTVNEDSGAMLRDTIKSINKFGACPESIWPYDISKLTVKPTATCYDTASRHTAVSYYQVSQNLNQLKGCLAEGYPFAFGMTVYDSFESDDVANNGIVQLPLPNEQQIGGHAVLVVGYDDSQQRFIVRNSWGIDWGMAGYFTMPYAYMINPDLATDFWTLRLVR